MTRDQRSGDSTMAVRVPVGEEWLQGDLRVPADARGLVLFAHGSGSGRHSPRNQYVARALESGGLATLLIDLLTSQEEALDLRTMRLRYDTTLLATRLASVVEWIQQQPTLSALPVVLFGASTGAGAALVTAAARPHDIAAVVSRGGRPDMAGRALEQVKAPTLLIVGGNDTPVILLNRKAMAQMHGHVALEIVPGATHLFEEPGALEEVARLAAAWFETHLAPALAPNAPV